MNFDAIRPYLSIRNLLVAAAAGVLIGVALERLIVTDAERINRILDRAAEAAEAGRWDEVVGFLDPSCRFEGLSPQELRQQIRDSLQDKPLKKVSWIARELEVLEGGAARAGCTVLITGMPGTPQDGAYPLRLDLRFTKKEKRWLVTAARVQ